MRVLLRRGTGNISAACVELALERGHHVGIPTRGERSVSPGVEGFLEDRAVAAALGEQVEVRDLVVEPDLLALHARPERPGAALGPVASFSRCEEA